MSAWQLDPRLANDAVPVADLPLCDVRLMDDAHHPWLVLVPKVPGAVELIDLDAVQRARLVDEIDRAARALKQLFAPDKLNVAALGNVVPQLHVHVIARYTTDITWPRPVWGAAHALPYEAGALVARVQAVRDALLHEPGDPAAGAME